MQCEYTDIRFVPKAPGKYKEWFCQSISDQKIIGEINYNQELNHYCYHPYSTTFYTGRCLGNIVDFIEQMNDLEKRESKSNKSEHSIQLQIHRELNSIMHVRLFRNNIGGAWAGTVIQQSGSSVTLKNPSYIKFGLHKGSGDLIGWRPVNINGKRNAQFFSVEVKNNRGIATAEQINWVEQVRAAGGIAGIVRSVSEALTLVNEENPL